MNIKDTLKDLIREQKAKSFNPDYVHKATDEEALGIMVSQYCEWDGIKIVRAFMEALEDSNFHKEVAKIEKNILTPLLK